MNYKRNVNNYYIYYVQQSPKIASTIDAIAFFCSIASLVILAKQKSTNYLRVFALPKYFTIF